MVLAACRISIALLVGFVACAGPRAHGPATRAAGEGAATKAKTSSRSRARRVAPDRSCGPTPKLQRFDVPRFALPNGAYASEVDGKIVIMHLGPVDRRPRYDGGARIEFHGAMYDLAAQTWIEIPAPPEVVLTGGLPDKLLDALPPGNLERSAHFETAGDHVAMLAYSSGPPRFSGEQVVATAVFDTLSRGWKLAAQDDEAPPREAYLTGPYRAQTTGRSWVWWPAHEGGTNYAGGYVLDMARAKWTRTSPDGAPSMRSFSRPQPLPDGRLVVIPVKSAEAGIYDPVANRWEPLAVPASEEGFEAVAVSDDGRDAAILHFVQVHDRQRQIEAFLVDLSTKTVDALPPDSTLIGYSTNGEMVHVDEARIVFVHGDTLHVFDREERRWSARVTPFETPVTTSGKLRHLCGNRISLDGQPWILHLDDLSWHELKWPGGVRRRARHTLHGWDHVVLVGDRWTQTEERRCPPGAPCVAPATHEVEVTESFLVPLESGA